MKCKITNLLKSLLKTFTYAAFITYTTYRTLSTSDALGLITLIRWITTHLGKAQGKIDWKVISSSFKKYYTSMFINQSGIYEIHFKAQVRPETLMYTKTFIRNWKQSWKHNIIKYSKSPDQERIMVFYVYLHRLPI